MTTKIHRAKLQLRHVSFEAFGEDPRFARFVLRKALFVHGREFNLPVDWADSHLREIKDTIVKVGHAYRDGAELNCRLSLPALSEMLRTKEPEKSDE